MTPTPMELTLLPQRYTLHRLPPDTPVAPHWLSGSQLVSLTRTEEELSILAPESMLIESDRQEGPWRAFKVAGPLDFELVGILAQLSTTLAEAHIPLFALSTFDTDYLLVNADRCGDAASALRQAGHTVLLL
ncbi:ACT domain-containing protein [Ferrimonas balearica]|uniref:ACT domain-containing protein n=1 Tax=Ferrimonas balearica TaxID=44012 RepID=UPI001C9A117E|nr:ACT domain-containing protein [Ferrimonas balearica]MBY5920079.1 ACT domain-containing protein [Ferrimonas balearica]MBY5997236.1 ACT domain-containing protein [Ferrimonas balearica]